MYLRYTTVKKDGKVHRYWRLVRSILIGKRVIQQTVAQLGELNQTEQIKARNLSRSLVGEPEQSELFNDGHMNQTVPIQLKGVRVENSRQFGDVYLSLALWRGMKLDQFCREKMEVGKEQVPWEKMASVLVAARLCEPSSELHIAEDWYRRTALEDLLELHQDKVNKDRLYRGLDQLLLYKKDLESHLSHRYGELFATQNEILLYDVTSTYFEGQAEKNEKAQRGYSRDHRGDCKQVCIGLVVRFDGFPLGYEVFAGNKHDSTTMQEIVKTMEERHGVIDRVWIMDRGMASDENIEWLKETKRRYIIGSPKSELKKWAPQLADQTAWKEIREGVEVQLVHSPEGKEIFILCRSKDRTQKEKAMHQKFSTRIEESLKKLKERISKSQKPLNKETINRQIGRILQKNQRSAARFDIQLEEDKNKAGFHLEVKVRKEFDEWAKLSEGTYVLRTNVVDWSDEKLWKGYIQLTQAESAFQIQKDELSIRPIWHQKADRVEAHIPVCFLAFVLWKALEFWQAKAGLGNSPRTILEELSQIQSQDILLPTQDQGTIRLRCVAQPNAAQSALLERLGLVLPKRIRVPEVVAILN